jgi:hypothetical protein
MCQRKEGRAGCNWPQFSTPGSVPARERQIRPGKGWPLCARDGTTNSDESLQWPIPAVAGAKGCSHQLYTSSHSRNWRCEMMCEIDFGLDADSESSLPLCDFRLRVKLVTGANSNAWSLHMG